MICDAESLLEGSEKVTGGAELQSHCWDIGVGLADFGGSAVNFKYEMLYSACSSRGQ